MLNVCKITMVEIHLLLNILNKSNTNKMTNTNKMKISTYTCFHFYDNNILTIIKTKCLINN